jgi:hypothetical protein
LNCGVFAGSPHGDGAAGRRLAPKCRSGENAAAGGRGASPERRNELAVVAADVDVVDTVPALEEALAGLRYERIALPCRREELN